MTYEASKHSRLVPLWEHTKLRGKKPLYMSVPYERLLKVSMYLNQCPRSPVPLSIKHTILVVFILALVSQKGRMSTLCVYPSRWVHPLINFTLTVTHLRLARSNLGLSFPNRNLTSLSNRALRRLYKIEMDYNYFIQTIWSGF